MTIVDFESTFVSYFRNRYCDYCKLSEFFMSYISGTDIVTIVNIPKLDSMTSSKELRSFRPHDIV